MSPFKLNGLILLMSVAFGFGYPAMKLVLVQIDPRAVILLRVIIATSVFFAVGLRRRPRKKIPLKDGIRLILCGFTGVVINQLLFATGLKYTTASHSSIINSAIPVLTLILATAVGQEKFKLERVVGFLVSMLGIAYLMGLDRLSFEGPTLFGDLLTLGNALSYSTYLVIARPLSSKYSVVWITGMIFAVGVIGVLPVGLGPLLQTDWASITAVTWVSFAYVILGMTIGAYGLVSYLFRHAESSHIAQGIYFQPLVGVFGSIWLLGEQGSSRVFTSLAIVLIGVALSQVRQIRAHLA